MLNTILTFKLVYKNYTVIYAHAFDTNDGVFFSYGSNIIGKSSNVLPNWIRIEDLKEDENAEVVLKWMKDLNYFVSSCGKNREFLKRANSESWAIKLLSLYLFKTPMEFYDPLRILLQNDGLGRDLEGKAPNKVVKIQPIFSKYANSFESKALQNLGVSNTVYEGIFECDIFKSGIGIRVIVMDNKGAKLTFYDEIPDLEIIVKVAECVKLLSPLFHANLHAGNVICAKNWDVCLTGLGSASIAGDPLKSISYFLDSYNQKFPNSIDIELLQQHVKSSNSIDDFISKIM